MKKAKQHLTIEIIITNELNKKIEKIHHSNNLTL